MLFDHVTQRAKALAGEKFKKDETKLPDSWLNMQYQQYRSIRFQTDQALWKDQSLFEVQFFHPGFFYKEPVEIEVANKDGVSTRIPFDTKLFRYDGSAALLAKDAVEGAGFAGFRIHYPLNNPEYKDEVMVFQGASYFRPVGLGQVYGLSARGLAVDTAEPTGEEFPRFSKFWLLKPGKDDTRMIFFALLDSPSVTGAYRFLLQPGVDSGMQITARLFARKDITKLGVAPLTSMFFYGENRTRWTDDFRPEVHDSDGVLMHTSHGEWIWRPLKNPRHLQVTSLQDGTPKGFGLVQRDRDFLNYQDVEAKYHQRPSIWITPQGDWGQGRLEIVEIPTKNETNDNIVSYWVPSQPMKAGEQREFNYQLQTFDGQLQQQANATVSRTRIGWAALPGQQNPPPVSERQFVVDFAGSRLEQLAANQPLEAKLQLSSGKTRDLIVRRLPTGEWRVSFKMSPQEQQTVDMHLQLFLRNQPLSEVWNYVWNPRDIK